MKPRDQKNRRASVNAFLLPLCPHCGAGMSLALLEIDPVDEEMEVRTFRCDTCGKQDVQRVGFAPHGACPPPRAS